MKISPYAKKASRRTAFDLVCSLKDGYELTTDQLESLLLYFAPSAPKKPKDVLSWLAVACTDDVREHALKRFIYVRQGRAIACDGHRFHEAHVDLDDGVYCPRTFARVDMALLDSDYERLEAVARRPDDLTSIAADALERGTLKLDRQQGKPILYVRVPDDAAVDETYYLQACAEVEAPDLHYPPKSVRQLLYGRSPFGLFGISGLRI